MITILQEPEEIVYSRNPVWFKFETDGLYNPEGQVGRFLLSFPGGPLTDGDTFDLNYSLSEQNFLVADAPDESGVQLRSGDGLSIADWCTQVREDFLKNYYLSNNYTISIDQSGPDPRLLFVSKTFDPAYDLSVNTQDFVSLSQLQAGILTLRQPNFRLILEVFVENADHTAFVKAGETLFPDVNDDGQAWFNLSKTLTQVLTAEGFTPPDPAQPAVIRERKSCRRYYLRYAEAFGTSQTIKEVSDTDIKWAVLGGGGKINVPIQISAEFIDDTKLKFLKQQPSALFVKQNQPEWLSLLFLDPPPAVVRLRCNITYSDETEATFTAYSLADVAMYDKITYPAGCAQLGVHQVDLTKIVSKYELFLEDGDENRLTEIRTYWLDYKVQEFVRYFIQLSSLGTYDTMVTYGKGSSEYEYFSSRAEITRSIDFEFNTGEVFEFDTSINDKINVASGFVTRRELRRFRDFFLSWDRYLVSNNVLYPLLINSKSIKERKDGDRLFALEFEFASRFSEELFTEDAADISAPLTDLSQYLPAVVIPDPDNFDDRYYLKSLTYNKIEVDALIASVLATEAAHHAAQQLEIDEFIADLQGKADTNHEHPELVSYAEFNEFSDAVSAALIYKGTWDDDYSVDPDESDVAPGYFENDRVEHQNRLWKSLVDENTVEPGTDPDSWEMVIGGASLSETTDADPLGGLDGDINLKVVTASSTTVVAQKLAGVWTVISTLHTPDAYTKTASDARYLQLSGGIMAGDIQQGSAPVNANSLVNKAYVDNLVTGLSWKTEVKAATIANITLSGTQTIDGIALIAGNRVLVKNQTAPAENGIWVVAAGSWTRANDADTTDELSGSTVMVRLGTINKDTQWTNTNTNEPVIGTDDITFVQIAGAGTYTNGTGLTLTGNVFSISPSYVGQSSIITLGTVTTGTWNAGVIPILYGGTGSATQNFVDLTTVQSSIGGAKTFTSTLTVAGSIYAQLFEFGASQTLASRSGTTNFLYSGIGGLAIVDSTGGTNNITISNAGAVNIKNGNLTLEIGHSLLMTGSVGGTGARVLKGWFTDIEVTNTPTIGGISIASIYAPIASPTFTGTVTTAALTASGLLTLSSANNRQLVGSSGATTGYLWGQIDNSGGSLKFGVENSTGNTLVTGADAYSTIFGSSLNRAVHLIANNAIGYTLSGSLNHNFKSGTATFGALLTGTSATFSASVAIGTSVNPAIGLYIKPTLAGVSQHGIIIETDFTSAATTQGNGIVTSYRTATAAFTMATGRGILIETPTINAGSAVTIGIGLDIQNQTGAGTNYAIRTGTGLVSFGGALSGTTATFSGVISIPTNSYFTGNATNGYRFNNAADNANLFVITDAGNATLAGRFIATTTVAANYHKFVQTDNAALNSYFQTSGTSPYGIDIHFSGAAPNNGTNYFINASDNAALRFAVYSNGGISNFSANNVNLSDEKYKKEVIEMESQWDIIKAFPYRKFKYDDQTHNDWNYGTGARALHKIAPHLVDTDSKDGKWRVYDTDIFYTQGKALQEALIRIEQLESQLNQ